MKDLDGLINKLVKVFSSYDLMKYEISYTLNQVRTRLKK